MMNKTSDKGVLKSQNKDIKESLFTDGALLTRIIDAHKHNEEALKQPKSCRKGYMGQLRLISNLIQKQANGEEWMHAYTRGEDWVSFCDTYLAELNDIIDGRQLGRSRVNGLGPQSDGEEEDDIETAVPLDSNFEFRSPDQSDDLFDNGDGRTPIDPPVQGLERPLLPRPPNRPNLIVFFLRVLDSMEEHKIQYVQGCLFEMLAVACGLPVL